jgi:S-adenosylmethionine:tRNA ribosyltransferase-isomerase
MASTYLAATYLAGHGRPIGYGYLAARYPLADHQTVYASQPGSAEMASAGRPFTAELLVRLLAGGVAVAPVVLHAGVSSPERHEPPLPERFEVPEDTARLVNSTRSAGRRVVAVGTTVVRALETAAATDGTVRGSSGWTGLVLGPHRPARVVTGLLTGLHAPEASHLLLLEAVAGAALVGTAYDAAVQQRYLWHEFGDSTLFLP